MKREKIVFETTPTGDRMFYSYSVDPDKWINGIKQHVNRSEDGRRLEIICKPATSETEK